MRRATCFGLGLVMLGNAAHIAASLAGFWGRLSIACSGLCLAIGLLAVAWTHRESRRLTRERHAAELAELDARHAP